ncbi:hypothetical protein CEH05_15860 [Halobacillus halophilus]|uniref:hypothetical protein n=1 Tax=Halobacillus halophilus TaxID=1570 RepID=UPI0002EF3C9B|nr:hypothetical protein [Halobacillus halophilus]ASF40546.1 hypothetical protein CEH05_15860 [Halobacillus halophilus]
MRSLQAFYLLMVAAAFVNWLGAVLALDWAVLSLALDWVALSPNWAVRNLSRPPLLYDYFNHSSILVGI